MGADGTIFVTLRSGLRPGLLCALNPDASVKWRLEIPHLGRPPIVDARGVLYLSELNSVYAINPDGTIKWRFVDIDGPCTVPVIGADGIIYVLAWDGLYAIGE